MDVDREILVLREKVADIRGQYAAITERIDMGDKNVRQGIEVVKEGLVQLQNRVEQIASQILGEEGKRALREDIADIRKSQGDILIKVTDVEKDLQAHTTKHALVEGGRRSWDTFKERWLAPIIVGLILVVPNLILVWVNMGS